MWMIYGLGDNIRQTKEGKTKLRSAVFQLQDQSQWVLEFWPSEVDNKDKARANLVIRPIPEPGQPLKPRRLLV